MALSTVHLGILLPCYTKVTQDLGPFGGPYNKEYRIFGYILGPRCLGKLPFLVSIVRQVLSNESQVPHAYNPPFTPQVPDTFLQIL